MKYYIDRIKKDNNGNIVRLNIIPVDDIDLILLNLDKGFDASVKYIMALIEHDDMFVTAPKTHNGYREGAELCIVEREGTRYLRTIPNEREGDNLESLPEY